MYGYQGYSNPYSGNYYQPQMPVPPQYDYQRPVDSISGRMVDSMDVVRGINADLSGKPSYFPKADGSEIYCKRINPQTGASMIQIYTLSDQNGQNTQESQLYTALAQFKTDISNELSDLKNTVLEGLTTPSPQVSSVKGGTK